MKSNAAIHRRTPNALLAGRRTAYRLVILQALVGLLWSLVVFLCCGAPGMVSALWGVVTVVLPNAVFAHKAFRFGGASNAKTIVRQFYYGQALKIALSMIVLTLAFAWGQAQPGPLFMAMVLGMLTQRLSLLWTA